jgi:hypothetical protein
MVMRTESELRNRLNELKEKEKEFSAPGMPHTSNRLIIRAQMKGILYALNEDKGFKVSWR